MLRFVATIGLLVTLATVCVAEYVEDDDLLSFPVVYKRHLRSEGEDDDSLDDDVDSTDGNRRLVAQKAVPEDDGWWWVGWWWAQNQPTVEAKARRLNPDSTDELPLSENDEASDEKIANKDDEHRRLLSDDEKKAIVKEYILAHPPPKDFLPPPYVRTTDPGVVKANDNV